MTRADLMTRFMRACIRGRDGRCLKALNDRELFEAFNTTPEPDLTFEEWCSRSALDLTAIEAAEQAAQTEASANIMAVLGAAGAPVSVGEVPPQAPANDKIPI